MLVVNNEERQVFCAVMQLPILDIVTSIGWVVAQVHCKESENDTEFLNILVSVRNSKGKLQAQ